MNDYDRKELTAITTAAPVAAKRIPGNTELLTRIDERVTYIRDVSLKEIAKHLETLNSNVATNTKRSIQNETSLRDIWGNYKALWTMVGLILAGIITIIVEVIKAL